MMDTVDFFYMGLDHLQVKRIQSNLVEMLQLMRLPDDADERLADLRARLKAKCIADHDKALLLKPGPAKAPPPDTTDALPDRAVFKWDRRGVAPPRAAAKAKEGWYAETTAYAGRGKTTAEPTEAGGCPEGEFEDSRLYYELRQLADTRVQLLAKRNAKELKRLHHAVAMSRAFFGRADTRRKWVQIGGVEALVHAARTWLHDDAPFLAVALRAMGFVACDAGTNARICHAGGLDIAKETIATFAVVDDESTMAKLAGHKVVAEHAKVEACVEAMYVVVVARSLALYLLQTTRYVFSRFTLRPAECHVAIGADCVEASLAAMRMFEHSSEVAHWGVVVLTNVAAQEVQGGKDAGKPKYWEMLNSEHAAVCAEFAAKEHKSAGAKELLLVLTTDPEEEERARLRLGNARKAREARRQEMQKRKEAAQKALEAEEEHKLHPIEFSHTDYL